MNRNTLALETSLLSVTVDRLRQRLPLGWSLSELSRESSQLGRSRKVDAAFSLTDPKGATATVIAEVKTRPVEAWQFALLVDQWKRILLPLSKKTWGRRGDYYFMVIAPYLGPSAKERLTEADISFADSTGNMRFVTARPAMYIETVGAMRNPWRESFPLRSLKGSRAGRAVRGLLDYKPPFGTRELASITDTPPAAISRVAELLEREAIVRRPAPRGPIEGVEWERLLRRWAIDYGFFAINQMTPFIAPRGLPRLFERLRNAEFTYALTGSFAAIRYAQVAEPRLVTIYTDEPAVALDWLELLPADTGSNVLLGLPFDSVVFDRAEYADGLTYAKLTQVAVDLLKAPGRGPQEGEALIEWMREREGTWQLPP